MSEKLTSVGQLRAASLEAKGLIGDVAAAAAEAIEAITPRAQRVTLTATEWVGADAPYAQAVAVPGVLEDSMAQLVHILPEDAEAWAAAGCRCTGQGAGTLAFEAEEKASMQVLVVLQEVAG